MGAFRRPLNSAHVTPRRCPIRALSVSLVAVAAVVVSLAVVKQRQAESQPEVDAIPDGAAAEVDLEGIRAAGF
jgi:hypothetical protein